MCVFAAVVSRVCVFVLQKEIMKKVGNPVPSNVMYNTVKVLLERIAPVMIDSIAIQDLVNFVSQAVKGSGDICDDIPEATENGMKLLLVGRVDW